MGDHKGEDMKGLLKESRRRRQWETKGLQREGKVDRATAPRPRRRSTKGADKIEDVVHPKG